MKNALATLPDPGAELRAGSVRWRVVPGEERVLEALRGMRFVSRSSVPQLEVLKDSRDVFWGRLRLDGKEYFVKGQRHGGARRLVRSVFRESRAREEWRKTWWLRARGIGAADPVAVGEVRRLGALIESYYVARWLTGSRNFLAYLGERERSLPAPAFARERRNMARLLGRLFGTLHGAGALHRQFHDRNVLVAEDERGEPRLYPIDLDHLTVGGSLSSEDRDWNFYQLAWHLRRVFAKWPAGPRDILAFLEGYAAALPPPAPRAKDLARWLAPIWPKAPLTERPRREDWRPPVR